MIKAEVICDSVSPEGKRLTTFKTRYPWFIHGEVMTHRVLSRNASSNRAIPLKKMLEEVRSDDLRAEPVYWGAEQKGMEPGGELDDIATYCGSVFNEKGVPHPVPMTLTKKEAAKSMWKFAAARAADCAEELGRIGLHKSLCNRLLMPFTHGNVIITATEWDNFFGLRLDKAADPTMRALAVAMWEAYKASEPVRKDPGDWHLPFADDAATWDDLEDYATEATIQEHIGFAGKSVEENIDALLIKISVARCARVSYESFDTGKRSTVEEDLRLYDRLLSAQPLHASPAEHQATPDVPITVPVINMLTDTGQDNGIQQVRVGWENEEEHGNLVGFRQYRKMLPGEAVAPIPPEFTK